MQKAHEEPHWTASRGLHDRDARDDRRGDRARTFAAGGTRPPACRSRGRRCSRAFRVRARRCWSRCSTPIPTWSAPKNAISLARELLCHVSAGQRGNAPLLELLNELRLAEIEAQRRRYFQAMEYLLGEPIGGRMHLDKNPAYNLTIPLMLRVFPGDALSWPSATRATSC